MKLEAFSERYPYKVQLSSDIKEAYFFLDIYGTGLQILEMNK